MPVTAPRSLAILGAGPVGLEAAALALELGFDVHVLERGEPGAHAIAWGHVRMFTPWRMNVGPASARLLARHSWSTPPAEERPPRLPPARRAPPPLAGAPGLHPPAHVPSRALRVPRPRATRGRLPGATGPRAH